MKNIYKHVCMSLSFMMIVCLKVNAQNFDVIFDFDEEDANSYMTAYATPSVLAFSNGLTGGWYNTAKPHKLWGFDLTAAVNVVSIPTAEETFDFNSINWNSLELASGSNLLPTLTGGETDTRLSIPSGTIVNGTLYAQDQEFDAPDGLDLPVKGVPTPTLQLGIGIVKNTDLKIRYVPTVDFEDGSFGLWGVGIMHDVKQWIPGIKLLPFNLSVLAAHTSMSLNYTIDESDGGFSAKGESSFNVRATTVQALISKKLSVVTPYLGVGYNITSSNLDLSDVVVNANFGAASDDVRFRNIEFEGGNSARVTAGLRLKLAIITFHADYTLQKYSMFSAGFGFNVR